MSRYSSFGIYLMLIVGLATYAYSHDTGSSHSHHAGVVRVDEIPNIGRFLTDEEKQKIQDFKDGKIKRVHIEYQTIQGESITHTTGFTLFYLVPPPKKDNMPMHTEPTPPEIPIDTPNPPTLDDTPVDTTEDTSEETTDQDSDDSYEPPSIPQRVDEQAVATREPPKIKITHIEHWQDKPFVWIIYVLNDERRFVSTAYIVLEIWNPEELASGDGQPKFSASLPREGRFAYQGVHRKHAYFTSPTGERANNAFLVASKKTFQNWNHRERHVKFAITSPHEQRVVYQKGDVFVLRDWKTKEIISQFPEPEAQEDAVPAAPIKPEIKITHIEHWQDKPFVWIIYVLNDERRFVSTAYIVLEIWNPEALASADGKPKFYVSLPREGRFAYQGVHRKHAYFTSPTGERANNAFLVASKKTFQNWDRRERHIKFAITRPHKDRMVYQEGDIFVLRDWKTKEIISQFPEPEAEEDAVPAAPIKPGLKLVTTWGSLKKQ